MRQNMGSALDGKPAAGSEKWQQKRANHDVRRQQLDVRGAQALESLAFLSGPCSAPKLGAEWAGILAPPAVPPVACSRCGEEDADTDTTCDTTLVFCKGCGQAYCSAQCRRMAWKEGHKGECLPECLRHAPRRLRAQAEDGVQTRVATGIARHRPQTAPPKKPCVHYSCPKIFRSDATSTRLRPSTAHGSGQSDAGAQPNQRLAEIAEMMEAIQLWEQSTFGASVRRTGGGRCTLRSSAKRPTSLPMRRPTPSSLAHSPVEPCTCRLASRSNTGGSAHRACVRCAHRACSSCKASEASRHHASLQRDTAVCNSDSDSKQKPGQGACQGHHRAASPPTPPAPRTPPRTEAPAGCRAREVQEGGHAATSGRCRAATGVAGLEAAAGLVTGLVTGLHAGPTRQQLRAQSAKGFLVSTSWTASANAALRSPSRPSSGKSSGKSAASPRTPRTRTTSATTGTAGGGITPTRRRLALFAISPPLSPLSPLPRSQSPHRPAPTPHSTPGAQGTRQSPALRDNVTSVALTSAGLDAGRVTQQSASAGPGSCRSHRPSPTPWEKALSNLKQTVHVLHSSIRE